MFKYTLAFIRRKDEILLLNRNKAPWLGSWNGVGGKREINELPIDCIIREIYEETSIVVKKNNVIDKGIVTWNSYDENGKGMHVYLVNIADDYNYKTPVVTEEGILDFKKISWIMDQNNTGICSNIPYFITDILKSNERYNHFCRFDGNRLIDVKKEVLK